MKLHICEKKLEMLLDFFNHKTLSDFPLTMEHLVFKIKNDPFFSLVLFKTFNLKHFNDDFDLASTIKDDAYMSMFIDELKPILNKKPFKFNETLPFTSIHFDDETLVSVLDDYLSILEKYLPSYSQYITKGMVLNILTNNPLFIYASLINESTDTFYRNWFIEKLFFQYTKKDVPQLLDNKGKEEAIKCFKMSHLQLI